MSRELFHEPLFPGDMVTYSCDSSMRIGIIKKATPTSDLPNGNYRLSIDFIYGSTSKEPHNNITSKLQQVPYKTVIKLRPEDVMPRLHPRMSAKFAELMLKYKTQ